jgi:hypothetical protein
MSESYGKRPTLLGGEELQRAIDDNIRLLVGVLSRKRRLTLLVEVGAVHGDAVGFAVGLVAAEFAAQGVEVGQALADQPGGQLAKPVGAVEDREICPRDTLAACFTISGSWSMSILSKATRLCEAAASAWIFILAASASARNRPVQSAAAIPGPGNARVSLWPRSAL